MPMTLHAVPRDPSRAQSSVIRGARLGALPSHAFACGLALFVASPAGARAPSEQSHGSESRTSEPRHTEVQHHSSHPTSDEQLPRLRPVLKGALFRSGTPSETGLAHLCETGWKRVYSLYGEHTTQAGPRNQNMLRHGRDTRTCQSERGQRTIEWRPAPSARMRSLPAIFADVLESVRSPDKGPVLVHCWNGLHYAGMVSALALRQFCGFTAEQAEAYWRANANRGANYPLIIDNLYKFKPIANLSLTPEEQAVICPDPSKGFLVSAEAFTGAPMNTRVAVTDPSALSGPPVPPLRQAGSSETLEIPRRGNAYTPPAPSPLDSARRAPEPSRGSEPAPAPSASSQGGRPPRNAALPSSNG